MEMKKIISLIISVIILWLSYACTNSKEINITSDMTIEIDTRPVINAFTEWNSGDLEMYEGASLKIICYIYDKDGNLVLQGSGLIDDYSVASWNIEKLPYGQYHVVCASYSVDDESEAYTINEADRLKDLVIQQNFYNTFYTNWACLGLAYKAITLGDKPVIELSLTPACSYVRLTYAQMTSIRNPNVDGAMFWMKNNRDVSFGKDISYSHKLASSSYYTTDASMPSGDYTGVYETLFLLPTESMKFFATYTLGGEREGEEWGNGMYSFKAGSQYDITIDCPNKEITVSSGVKSLDDSGAIDKIQKSSEGINVCNYFNLK